MHTLSWFGQVLFGPLLRLTERLSVPRTTRRDPDMQRAVDARTRDLVLYQSLFCPYCIRVRRVIRQLGLDIETRNALHHVPSRRQLLKCGGKLQVPCLRIRKADGRMQWLYESGDIIRYLEERFAVHET